MINWLKDPFGRKAKRKREEAELRETVKRLAAATPLIEAGAITASKLQAGVITARRMNQEEEAALKRAVEDHFHKP